jgi:hypothetical protein
VLRRGTFAGRAFDRRVGLWDSIVIARTADSNEGAAQTLADAVIAATRSTRRLEGWRRLYGLRGRLAAVLGHPYNAGACRASVHDERR